MYTVEFLAPLLHQRDKKMFNSQVMARSFIILPPPFSFPSLPCVLEEKLCRHIFSAGLHVQCVLQFSFEMREREREGGEMKARIKSERIVWAELCTATEGIRNPPKFPVQQKGRVQQAASSIVPPTSPGKNKFFSGLHAPGGSVFTGTHTHAFCERSCVSVWISVAFHLLFLHPFYGRCCCCCCYEINPRVVQQQPFYGHGTFLEFAQLCCVSPRRGKRRAARLCRPEKGNEKSTPFVMGTPARATSGQ